VARAVEHRGPTVDAAVQSALDELGVTEQDVRVEVIYEPAEGQEALVRVSVRAPEVDIEELEEQADAVADFLEELLAKMDIDAIAEPTQDGPRIYVDIVDGDEDDLALLIGRHGQTLDSIQELTRMIVGNRLDERIRVIVDVEDYRKRREAKLVEDARGVAERVAETGVEEELDAMTPYERKLVHDAAGEVAGVRTSSRGEEPNRYVVIFPA
jgi:spoIIIJ-associated protein